MGLRKEGILQVHEVEGGGGAPVGITSPLGSNLSADSISVTFASNEPSSHVIIDSMPAGGSGLTDAELRATAVPISASATDALITALGDLITIQTIELQAKTEPANQQHVIIDSGSSTVNVGLTDAQLRAVAVPISGTVTANAGTNLNTSALATSAKQDNLLTELQLKADLTETQPVSLASVPSHAVTGPLTDAQLRATPVPVSGTVAVTATDLDIRNLTFATDKVDASGSTAVGVTNANLDVALSTRLKPADTLTAVTTVGTITNPVSSKIALTPSAPIQVSVGVASGAILASNAARKSARLVNTSTARISISFGATAVLDSGMTLYPGGSFNMDEYDFYTGAINGIASAAASNIGVQEFTT